MWITRNLDNRKYGYEKVTSWKISNKVLNFNRVPLVIKYSNNVYS